jgi:hypothetical protein
MVGRRCGKYPTSIHINEPFDVVSSPVGIVGLFRKYKPNID